MNQVYGNLSEIFGNGQNQSILHHLRQINSEIFEEQARLRELVRKGEQEKLKLMEDSSVLLERADLAEQEAKQGRQRLEQVRQEENAALISEIEELRK